MSASDEVILPIALRNKRRKRISRPTLQPIKTENDVANVSDYSKGSIDNNTANGEANGSESDTIECIKVESACYSMRPSRKHCKRLRVYQSESEDDLASNLSMESSLNDSASESKRKSTRLRHKRNQAKKFLGVSVIKKLRRRTLDNCLQQTKDESSESAVDDVMSSHIRGSRKKSLETKTKRVRSPDLEVDSEHEEFLSDFICADSEVEYMDAEGESVSENESLPEPRNFMNDDANWIRFDQSRSKKEWFHIYIQYLEQCILDSKKVCSDSSQDELLRNSVHHIEREICSRYESLSSGGTLWPSHLSRCVDSAACLKSMQINPQRPCDACNHPNHIATHKITFNGYAMKSKSLFAPNWIKRLRQACKRKRSIHGQFNLGSVCHSRVLLSWELAHAKRMWVALVDSCIQSGKGSRISSECLTTLAKAEYERYKRLLRTMEEFVTGSKATIETGTNVWKDVYVIAKCSKFTLMNTIISPSLENRAISSTESSSSDSDNSTESSNQIEDSESDHENRPRIDNSTMEQDCNITTESASDDISGADAVKELKCLICTQNQRNGAVLHDDSIHYYCCYECGLNQFRNRAGCFVCGRTIVNVFQVLPLNSENAAL